MNEDEVEVEWRGRVFYADVAWNTYGPEEEKSLHFEVRRVDEGFGATYGTPWPLLTDEDQALLNKAIREKWEGEMERRAEERDERMRDR